MRLVCLNGCEKKPVGGCVILGFPLKVAYGMQGLLLNKYYWVFQRRNTSALPNCCRCYLVSSLTEFRRYKVREVSVQKLTPTTALLLSRGKKVVLVRGEGGGHFKSPPNFFQTQRRVKIIVRLRYRIDMKRFRTGLRQNSYFFFHSVSPPQP